MAVGPTRVHALALPYAQTYSFEFINYNDQLYVTDNNVMMQGLTRESILWAFTSVKQGGNFHPLTWPSHLLDTTITSGLGMPVVAPSRSMDAPTRR